MGSTYFKIINLRNGILHFFFLLFVHQLLLLRSFHGNYGNTENKNIINLIVKHICLAKGDYLLIYLYYVLLTKKAPFLKVDGHFQNL